MNMLSQDWLAVIQKEYVQNYLRQGGTANHSFWGTVVQ